MNRVLYIFLQYSLRKIVFQRFILIYSVLGEHLKREYRTAKLERFLLGGGMYQLRKCIISCNLSGTRYKLILLNSKGLLVQ